MFLLTREEDSVESGAYASIDDDGHPIVQFFIDKDDAMTYNVHLEALGQNLHVTETDNDFVDKLCGVRGHAYTIVEPGEIVIPRFETLHNERSEEEE